MSDTPTVRRYTWDEDSREYQYNGDECTYGEIVSAFAYDALAAENAALREALSMLCASAEKFVNGEQTVNGIEDDIQYALEVLTPAPAAPGEAK